MSNALPTIKVIEQHLDLFRHISVVEQAMAELNDAVDVLRDQLDALGLPTTIPEMAKYIAEYQGANHSVKGSA